jgi:hypothetical protein
MYSRKQKSLIGNIYGTMTVVGFRDGLDKKRYWDCLCANCNLTTGIPETTLKRIKLLSWANTGCPMCTGSSTGPSNYVFIKPDVKKQQKKWSVLNGIVEMD